MFVKIVLVQYNLSGCANVASSDVSSCAAPGGRIGRRSGSRRRTGRVWHPCVSGSGASARPNGRNASRSCPTYTCTASHLQEEGDKGGLVGAAGKTHVLGYKSDIIT